MSSDYTIVDITDAEPRSEYNAALSVVLGETPKVPPLTAREDLVALLVEWQVRHDLITDDGPTLGTDDDEDLTITFDGLTKDYDGHIVRKTREYVVTASFTVEVQYWVEASSEDEARDAAEDEFNGLGFDTDSDIVVYDTQYDGIADIEEQ